MKPLVIAGADLRSEERRDSVRGSGFVRAVGRGVKKKNGSGESGLRFIAERASAPLKDSLEAAGLCRRNPSVRVTGEPTKREQTRLLGPALTGGCVLKNPPDLQAGVHYVVVDFPVLSWQRRQDNWEQKRQFYPQQHVEKKARDDERRRTVKVPPRPLMVLQREKDWSKFWVIHELQPPPATSWWPRFWYLMSGATSS